MSSSKEAIELWDLCEPLADFADEYEIWQTNLYTINKTLGEGFKGSIVGYVKPEINKDYCVEFASGQYKLAAYTPNGKLIQELNGIGDLFVRWVGIHKLPFVGYVNYNEGAIQSEGVAWIIVPKSREQLLSCASEFYKRRNIDDFPNIIDLQAFLKKDNQIGKVTDSSSFVPLRKRNMEGVVRLTATKKRIDEYRKTAPELTNEVIENAIQEKYCGFFISYEDVAIEAIKESFRNGLPLTIGNILQQLEYLVEDRKLLKYYTALQHIYSPEAQRISSKAGLVVEKIYTEACKRTCRLSEFADKEVMDYFNNESYKHRKEMTLADKLNNLCCNYHCRINGIVSCYPDNFPPFRPVQKDNDVVFVNQNDVSDLKQNNTIVSKDDNRSNANEKKGCLSSIIIILLIPISILALYSFL